MLLDGQLHEIKSLTYYLGTATRTKTKTESTRKLPLSSRTIQHCIELLNEALREQEQKKALELSCSKD